MIQSGPSAPASPASIDVYSRAAEAALRAAQLIRDAIAQRGAARLLVATGNSQIALIEALVRIPGIDWSKVTSFHLDEYVAISPEHPALFLDRFSAARLPRRSGKRDAARRADAPRAFFVSLLSCSSPN